VKARGKLMLGPAMLAIGADVFGVEHGSLSFEQLAQIWRQRRKSGGIDARRHANKSISCDTPNEANPAD
jgi:hypothetical protein